MSDITLVVQSDDFGMCHAVNAGVVDAFRTGILTQSSVMVPCPWFDEAAELALEHGLPVGVHCTLTAEWDHLRWPPLTSCPGLRAEDGTFHRTIEAARKGCTADEATAELVAQTERFQAAGLEPCYFDCHMGIVHAGSYVAVCEKFGRRFIYPIGGVAYPFTTRASLSAMDAGAKLPWLLDWLEKLGPGEHILVTHCGVGGEELSSLARPDAGNYVWTQPYRVSDLATLTAPEPRKLIEKRGIRLASVSELV
jgi:hypothetical protein